MPASGCAGSCCGVLCVLSGSCHSKGFLLAQKDAFLDPALRGSEEEKKTAVESVGNAFFPVLASIRLCPSAPLCLPAFRVTDMFGYVFVWNSSASTFAICGKMRLDPLCVFRFPFRPLCLELDMQ